MARVKSKGTRKQEITHMRNTCTPTPRGFGQLDPRRPMIKVT